MNQPEIGQTIEFQGKTYEVHARRLRDFSRFPCPGCHISCKACSDDYVKDKLLGDNCTNKYFVEVFK